MLRTFFLAALLCATAFAQAPVDVNQASVAQLDSIKGVGPGLSSRILDERARQPFRDWSDLIDRVPGIGAKAAVRLSGAGLRVQGQAFPVGPAAAAAASPTSDPPAASGAAPSGAGAP